MQTLDPNRPVGPESSKSYVLKIANGFYTKYLSGEAILEIGYKGGASYTVPIVPQAIGIDLDYPGYNGETLPFADETQDAVYSSHCLEHIDASKDAIQEWFRVLKIGGYLIIVVPHQHLYERRLYLPSRWAPGWHKRFYTPASLLREIEDALEPNTYRIRHLVDNDYLYDYSTPLTEHPVGCYEIEFILQKINKPNWLIDDEPKPLPPSEPASGDSAASPAPAQTDIPTLKARHLCNAALFADRYDLIRSLAPLLRGGEIAELGVSRGDFSAFLMETLEPRLFVGFDIFNMHEYPELWGIPSRVFFEGKTHLEFFRDRFRDRGSQVLTEVGLSHVQLSNYPDDYFDMIYIDADHSYEGVKRDAQISVKKLKKTGVLIFNDYTMFDPIFANVPYGVVRAVNEMVVNEGWRVIGFAFERNMFCDIAIRRDADLG
jgi:hypothetical protein